jgi:hypothetical protein
LPGKTWELERSCESEQQQLCLGGRFESPFLVENEWTMVEPLQNLGVGARRNVDFLLTHWNVLVFSCAVLVGTIVLSLITRFLIFLLLKRVIAATRAGIGSSIVRHIEKASWWIFPLLGLLIVSPAPIYLTASWIPLSTLSAWG